MLLTKDQILKVQNRLFENVVVPELEGELRLASFSAAASIAIQEMIKRQEKGEEMGRQILVLSLEKSIVDANGDQMFDTAGASALFERISLQSAYAIIQAIPSVGKKTPNAPAVPTVPPSPSEASPVAA